MYQYPAQPQAGPYQGNQPHSNNNGSHRALADLVKMYNHNDSKFGGDKYDILDDKIKVFMDLCRKAGVEESQYHEAFSTMLKGRALQYYYDHLSMKGLNFQEMVTRTKNFFHTVENTQIVIMENPDDDLATSLEKLIVKLERVHKGLAINYTGDTHLKEGLMNAVQGHPAFGNVLLRPATTFDSLCSELRSAAGIAQRCRAYQEQASRTNTQYWTDRTYRDNGNQKQHSQNRYKYQKGKSYGRRYDNKRSNKKCFVCGKHGCWSTKHPTTERKAKYNSWRRYAQESGKDDTKEGFERFLIEYEGENDTEEEEGDDYDNWESQHPDEDGSDTEERACTPPAHYTTEYGKVDGYQVANILANQAAYHAFTGSNTFDSDGEDENHKTPTAFYLEDKYSRTFQGILPDTGAAGISSGGEPQMNALQRSHPHIKLDTTTAGQHIVRFGDNPEQRSLGTVDVPTPFGTVQFQIMPSNTPFLLCLKDMDRLGIFLNNVKNVLTHKDKEYPIVRKWGHPWFLLNEREQTIAYCHLTETELRTIHRRFGHPAAERLHNILTKAGFDEIDKTIIDKINKYCHQCQMHGSAPGRFKFTLKNDVDFNHSVYVDVMYIKNRPVLHAIDKATSFQAAKFLKDMTAKHTWDTLRAIWIDTYLGPPDMLIYDAGKNFTAGEFTGNAKGMSITTEEVPVEAHNSIGQLERYHGPLRRAYEVISEDMHGTETEMHHVLQMAVKAVNDTAGPDGLVPTLLVFGAYPKLAETSPSAHSVAERAAAIKRAMEEVRKLKMKRQVDEALGMRNGPNTLSTLELPLQSKVRVFRENKGWKGPYRLVGRDGETCVVEINNRPVKFRTTVVKPYHEDDNTVAPHAEGDSESDSNSDDMEGDEYAPQPEEHIPRRPRGRPPGSKNKPKEAVAHWSPKEEEDAKLAIQLRREGKITTPGKPFEESDRQEIEGLLGRGVFLFEKYDKEKHGDTRIFNSRVVHEIKGKTTDRPYEKSRLIIQGYNDEGKKAILIQSPTIQRSSQRTVLALAPSLCKMKTGILSGTPLNRTIIAKLPKELRHMFPEGTIMTAGIHWWATYFKHHRERLSMTTSTYDPCLLVTTTPERFGLVAMQTDDTLGVSDKIFDKLEDEELREAGFLAKPKTYLTEEENLIFNGCTLSKDNEGNIHLRQKAQGKKITIIEANKDDTLQQYVQQRARGAYISSICQPEATFDVMEAAQYQAPGKDEIAKLNKRLQWQRDNLQRGIRYVPIDLTAAKVFVFIGYEIFVANETKSDESFTMHGNLIHWSSTKCRRMTRSVLASEIYAMIHGVDMGLAVGTTVTSILEQLKLPNAPVIVCTDSLSLYECIIHGEDNPADAMTKSNANKALKEFIDTNRIRLRLQGWVKRN
ncbi:putative transposase [Daldinia bambusicola]|nr:putative transposase [Daldinia bambusicola]